MKIECDLDLEHQGRHYRLRSAEGEDRPVLDFHIPGGTALLAVLQQAYQLRRHWGTALRWLPRPLEVRVWLRGRKVTHWSWL